MLVFVYIPLTERVPYQKESQAHTKRFSSYQQMLMEQRIENKLKPSIQNYVKQNKPKILFRQ